MTEYKNLSERYKEIIDTIREKETLINELLDDKDNKKLLKGIVGKLGIACLFEWNKAGWEEERKEIKKFYRNKMEGILMRDIDNKKRFLYYDIMPYGKDDFQIHLGMDYDLEKEFISKEEIILKELTKMIDDGLISLKYTKGSFADDEPNQAYLDYHYFETKDGKYRLKLTELKNLSKEYKEKDFSE